SIGRISHARQQRIQLPLTHCAQTDPIRHTFLYFRPGGAMVTRVLVVDDEPVQRRLLDAMLRRLDYEPVLTEGGQEALDLLSGPEGAGIGCVVLDLVMPDLDGFT